MKSVVEAKCKRASFQTSVMKISLSDNWHFNDRDEIIKRVPNPKKVKGDISRKKSMKSAIEAKDRLVNIGYDL